MRTNIVKWVSIAALLLTASFWSLVAEYQLALNVVVSVAAVVVAVQAFQQKKRLWAAGFLAMVLMFNPAVPVFRLSGWFSFCLIVLSIAPFAFSVTALKPRPLLSVPSITNQSPSSEAL
jgi:hypothetical protein